MPRRLVNFELHFRFLIHCRYPAGADIVLIASIPFVQHIHPSNFVVQRLLVHILETIARALQRKRGHSVSGSHPCSRGRLMPSPTITKGGRKLKSLSLRPASLSLQYSIDLSLLAQPNYHHHPSCRRRTSSANRETARDDESQTTRIEVTVLVVLRTCGVREEGRNVYPACCAEYSSFHSIL